MVPAYRISELPRPKRIVRADYPAEARKKGIEGKVILQLTIDETGNVTNVKVIQGIDSELDRTSQEAARSFLFEPAKLDGVAMATVIQFTYNWKIID
jgi:protein TonB